MPPKLKLEDLDDLKVAQLKEHCKKLELKVSGSKVELIARLKDHLSKKGKAKAAPTTTMPGGNNSQATTSAPTSTCPAASDSNKEEEPAGQHPSKPQPSDAPTTVSEESKPPIESDAAAQSAIQASTSESVCVELTVEDTIANDAPTKTPEELRLAEETKTATLSAAQNVIVTSANVKPDPDFETDTHSSNVISDQADSIISKGAMVPVETSKSPVAIRDDGENGPADVKPIIEADTIANDAPTMAPDDMRPTEEGNTANLSAAQNLIDTSVDLRPATEAELDDYATNVMSDQAGCISKVAVVPIETLKSLESAVAINEGGEDSATKAMAEDKQHAEPITEASENISNELGDTPEAIKQACAVEESAPLGKQEIEDPEPMSDAFEKQRANETAKSEIPLMEQHQTKEKEKHPESRRDPEAESKHAGNTGRKQELEDPEPMSDAFEKQRANETAKSDIPVMEQHQSKEKETHPESRRDPEAESKHAGNTGRSRSDCRKKNSSQERCSQSRKKRSLSRKRSPSRRRRSLSGKRSSSCRKRSPSRRKRSPSRRKRSPSRRKRSPSRRKRSPSRKRRSPSRRRRRSPSWRRRSPSRRRSRSRRRRSPSRRKKSASRRRRSPSSRRRNSRSRDRRRRR